MKDLEDIEKSCIFALGNQNFTDMARNAKKKSETDIFHVMLRGINRQGIFKGKMNEEPSPVQFLRKSLLLFLSIQWGCIFCHAQSDYVGYVKHFYDTMYEQHAEKGIETITVGGNVYALKDLCFNKSKDDFNSMITNMEVYSLGYHLSSILELKFNDGSSLYYEVWSDCAQADDLSTYEYDIVEIYDTEGKSLSSKGMYLKCGAGVNDPDGYVNVRSEKSASSKVVTKITKDQIFLYTPSSKSNWWRVYLKDGGKCVGYVYKDKILPYRECRTEIKKKIEHEMNCEAH